MPICPRCRRTYAAEWSGCPHCFPEVQGKDSAEDSETARAIVEIYRVPDEITGISAQAFLRSEGIPALLLDMRASFYGNVLSGIQGFWGKLLVLKDQEEAARRLLAVFLRGTPEP